MIDQAPSLERELSAKEHLKEKIRKIGLSFETDGRTDDDFKIAYKSLKFDNKSCYYDYKQKLQR